MSNSLVDEADLGAKLTTTLNDFAREFGQPPASTSILFEPHHECWGIYHSLRQMSCDDSPGDYEIQNAEVGTMPASANEYERGQLESLLRDLGKRLIRSVDDRLRPEMLGLELDYDRVYTFPDDETKMG